MDYSNGNGSNLSLFDWIYDKEEDFRKQYEDINVPIKIVRYHFRGRFKK
jgi:hypothetical protein